MGFRMLCLIGGSADRSNHGDDAQGSRHSINLDNANREGRLHSVATAEKSAGKTSDELTEKASALLARMEGRRYEAIQNSLLGRILSSTEIENVSLDLR